MHREFCDICGRDTIEHSMDDLFGSRTYRITREDANTENPLRYKLTLCCSCKENMLYLIRNPEVLRGHIENMSFLNRVRFLFKQELKREGEHEID